MQLLRPFSLCLVLLLLWQGIVSLWQIPDYLLPSPIQVFTTLCSQYSVLLTHAIPTLLETIFGLVLGILLGCAFGCFVAFFKPLRPWFVPLLIISQAIPTFAIAPLFVIWLGYGLASKIAIAVLMIFFPIASALYDGLRQTQIEWQDLAKTMNATRWCFFRHILIPAALPTLASGIRIAAVVAPLAAIVGEWVGSSRGLGYLILNANARLQIDMMFAALIFIIILTIVLYLSVDKLLRRLIWW